MSTLAIYDALKDNQKFYTIDIIKDLRVMPKSFFDDGRVNVIYGDCVSDGIVSLFENESIDFLFSDTIHYYKQVDSEFKAYKNKLKDNSIIFMDDIKLNDKGRFYEEWEGEKYSMGNWCHETGFGLFKFKNKMANADIVIWYNHDRKLGFLGIPKCASTTLRVFTGCNTLSDTDIPEDYNGFTVIREPVERYVSGFIEVMYPAPDYPKCRYHHNLNLSNDVINDLDNINKILDDIEKFKSFTEYIIENGFFEPHTFPQSFYLNNDDRFKIYKMENLDQLSKDLGLGKAPNLNRTSNNAVKKKLLKFLKEDKFVSKIEGLYKEDIKIYNSL